MKSLPWISSSQEGGEGQDEQGVLNTQPETETQDVEQSSSTASEIPKTLSTPNPAAVTQHSASTNPPPTSPPGAMEKPLKSPQPQSSDPPSSVSTQQEPKPSDGKATLESSGKADLPQANTVEPSGKGDPPTVLETTPTTPVLQPTPTRRSQQDSRTRDAPSGKSAGSSELEQGWE